MRRGARPEAQRWHRAREAPRGCAPSNGQAVRLGYSGYSSLLPSGLTTEDFGFRLGDDVHLVRRIEGRPVASGGGRPRSILRPPRRRCSGFALASCIARPSRSESSRASPRSTSTRTRASKRRGTCARARARRGRLFPKRPARGLETRTVERARGPCQRALDATMGPRGLPMVLPRRSLARAKAGHAPTKPSLFWKSV
jgi:hypothetical protein